VLHALPISSLMWPFQLYLASSTIYEACLCGLVVRVPGYRSRGPGSIPSTFRFLEKWWVWNGVHSAS
jgi:hypothetical protein